MPPPPQVTAPVADRCPSPVSHNTNYGSYFAFHDSQTMLWIVDDPQTFPELWLAYI